MSDAPPWHVPVMIREVMEMLIPGPGRLLLDLTIGDGGHAVPWLEAGGTVVGIDRDSVAVARTARRLATWAGQLDLIHGSFSMLRTLPATPAPDAVLFDLGTSRVQLETAGRGFSYLTDGPLDMRMDCDRGDRLADILRTVSVDTLATWLRDLGDVPQARRLARAILRAGPPSSTAGLAAIVARHCPPRLLLKYLSCVFQALRMAVNDEREELRGGLEASMDITRHGARIAVLTYHSGEERQVRAFFRRERGQCSCPSGLPVCSCGALQRVVTVESGRRPSRDEIESNPRARSARLWVVERTDVH